MITVKDNCAACGVCVDICPVTALRLTHKGVVVDTGVCIDCGICSRKCPFRAIEAKNSSNQDLIRDIRFQVTKACNFDCPYCFSDAKAPLENELSLFEAKGLVNELISCGLKTLTFTGGEPLMRKDLVFSLLDYLHKNKIYTKLFTNGALLDKEAIAKLMDIANEVQISVHGHTDAHGWQKMRLLFIQLKKKNIRTALRITLTSRNYKKVKEVVKFAGENKVDILRVRPFIAQGRGLMHQGYLMGKRAAQESIGYLASVRRTKNYPIQLLTPSLAFLYDRHIKSGSLLKRGFIGYTSCKCIDAMGTILPDGSVRACAYFPQDLGNIRKDSFSKIWSEKNKLKRELKVKRLDKKCMDCAYVSICGGGCRANAYVNAGSLKAPDPQCFKN